MSALATIIENGEPRKLGALPRVMSRCGDGLITELEDTYLVDPPMWDEVSKRVSPIARVVADQSPHINQKQQGSCTYSAFLHCIMQRRKEAGYDDVLLAQCTGYAWGGIDSAGNLIPRRRDDGMSLDFACLLGRIRGGIPVKYVNPLDWERNNWPKGWEVTAYNYSVDKWRDASRSMDMIVSSLLNILPVLHGYAGHSRMLVSYDAKKRVFPYKNTYGRDWGDGGFGELTWRQVDEGRKQYGAFVPITVRDPVGDGDVPTTK